MKNDFSRRLLLKMTLLMACGFLLVIAPLQLLPQAGSKSKSSKSGAAAKHPVVRKASAAPSGDRIIDYVRAKFGVPKDTSIAVDALHSAPAHGFLDTLVKVDDGKGTKTSKRTSVVSVSSDGRYLLLGMAPANGPNSSPFYPIAGNDDIGRVVKDAFHVPEGYTFTPGPLRASPFPGFYATTITVEQGGKKQPLDAYVTRDHHFLVLATIYDMGIDPRRQALRTLVLQNQPFTGPANAPVTLVEFADLECPTCARTQEFLEKNLLPTYSGKIRLIFKEFPLIQIHEWAMTGAIACQCGYRQNPADYLPYRSLIFQHQNDVDAIQGNMTEVRERLLDYGAQVGLDRLQLAGCLDSKATLPRITENMNEAKKLDVNSTPTFFVNGKILPGGSPPEDFYQAIDEALHDTKAGK